MQDRGRDTQAGEDEERRDRIRAGCGLITIARSRAPMTRAAVDEVAFAQEQELAADDPARDRPGDQADHDHQVEDARAEDGHRDQQQDDRREAHDDVDDPHDHEVRPPVEAGDRRRGSSRSRSRRRSRSARPQRHAAADERPGEHRRGRSGRSRTSAAADGGWLAMAEVLLQRRRLVADDGEDDEER